MKITKKLSVILLVFAMMIACLPAASVSADAQGLSVAAFYLADSAGTELSDAPIDSADDKLYLTASVTNQTAENKPATPSPHIPKS